MKSKLLSSVPAIVLGALIAIAPQTFAPPCPMMGEHPMPMKCHWTAQASLGIGIAIAVLGVLCLVFDARVRAGLSMAVAVIALVELAMVYVLIGTCGSPMMRCENLMKPTLLICSVLLLLTAILAVIKDLKAGTNA